MANKEVRNPSGTWGSKGTTATDRMARDLQKQKHGTYMTKDGPVDRKRAAGGG